MAVSKSWLRAGATALVIAGLLGLGMGCKGKHNDNVASNTVYGWLTYTRVPLHLGTDGLPSGLETDSTLFTTLPARGVQVRAFQSQLQYDSYGNATTVWLQAGSTMTDGNGYYAFSGLLQGNPTFIEMDSVAAASGTVRLVADPAGVDSLVPEPSRVIYAMRKGVDGGTSTTSATPGAVLSVDTEVDFTVGLTDSWLLTPYNWNLPANGPFPNPPRLAAGSRVLAILDSIYTFAVYYGNPTPSNYLDLHYNPNVRNARGSFVEYNPAVYPLAFDDSVLHFFGSIAGGQVLNGVSYEGDAFYEGVIFPLLARNHLYAQHSTVLYPTGASLSSLTPPMAVLEGLPDTMTATLMGSPYLPDTSLPARFPCRDIRDLSKVTLVNLPNAGAYSAPTIAALGWAMTLDANGIPAPGWAAEWTAIAPANLLRLFGLVKPYVTLGTLDVTSDVNSIFAQVGRMQEGQTSADSVDLLSYFPDSVLTPLLSPFNMTWSGISYLPSFTTDWGKDPNSITKPLAPFTLSMAQAQQVRGAYPNFSAGEVANYRFTLSVDRSYDLSVTTTPALPAGATLELTMDGSTASQRVYLFGGTNPASNRITLSGNFYDPTNPTFHYLQVRLVSPTVLQPDLAVTVNLPIVSPTDPTVVTTQSLSTAK